MPLHKMYSILERSLPRSLAPNLEEDAETADVAELRKQVETLRAAVEQSLDVLHVLMGAQDDPHTLHVQLPRAQSFEDLSEAIDDLSFVVERTIELQFPDAEAVIRGFAPSAHWLAISIEDQNALMALARIFSLSAAYMEEKHRLREREAPLMKDLSGEQQRQFIGMMEQSLPLVRRELAMQFNTAKEHLDDIAMAIELSAKWFERGGDFAPSKAASGEVKDAFEEASAKVRAQRRRAR